MAKTSPNILSQRAKFANSYQSNVEIRLELHPALKYAIERGPSTILNVGCADGFYAVGMAMRLSKATIFASDADPKAIRATMRNAELNGVAKQVVPIGIIHPGELDRYLKPFHSLLIMDCEGAEFSLLNPKNDPVLSSVDMIVEVHLKAGSSERLWRQFEKTHQYQRLYYLGRQGIADELTHQYQRLHHLGRQGIADELRDNNQEWLVLNVLPRSASSRQRLNFPKQPKPPAPH
jgi:ribosomal protein L11 methylase PrmA